MRSVYRPQIETAAAAIGWDPLLLEAQVLIESSDNRWAFRYESAYFIQYIKGNPAAKAFIYGPLAACSYGLLQILYETARERDFFRSDGTVGQPHDLFDPAVILRLGCRDLAWLRPQIVGGDPTGILAAYNGGLVGNLVRPYRNAAYAQKVLAMQETFHA